jgi:hypothetical protein
MHAFATRPIANWCCLCLRLCSLAFVPGYIDLSKRRVSPEDILKAEEKFNKSKAVHSIMRHVSETCHVRLEDIYNQFGWDLYKRFGHAYDAFKLIVTSVRSSFRNIAGFSPRSLYPSAFLRKTTF